MNTEVNPEDCSLTLDLAGAAALCKCGAQHLRTLARSGAIPATRVGRRWVFSTRLLQEWIETRSRANVRVLPVLRPRTLGGLTVTRALIANTAAVAPDQRKNSS